MRCANLQTLAFVALLIGVFNCYGTGKESTVTNEKSADNDTVVTLTNFFEKINPDEPGTITTNPKNFRQIKAVRWDGKSKMKSGVRYTGHVRDCEKLAKIDERFRKIYERMKKDKEQIKKNKKGGSCSFIFSDSLSTIPDSLRIIPDSLSTLRKTTPLHR
jgi:hypothetical protein